MRKLIFEITKEWHDQQIRIFLKDFGVSSALLTRLKQNEEGIKLNGKHARAIDTMHLGDKLTITMKSEGTPPSPVLLPIQIVYEDTDIVVANKPFGMPVHESRNHRGDTLSNAISYHCKLRGAFRSVYRLDRDTSGLVLIAKNTLAASKLAGKIKKDYYAIVCGKFSGSGTIDAPIKRVGESIIERCVSQDGEKAITHWQCVKTENNLSLLKINLETGRTHQIRVHFASLNAPLLGDTLYGTPSSKIKRQALHCKTILFTHPITEKQMKIDCDFPKDFEGLI